MITFSEISGSLLRTKDVWERNFRVFMKTWKVNFLPPFIEPILYLLALGFGVGSFINAIEGVSYARFIAPGLVAISVMNASFFECTYASFVRMYYQKVFDAIIATPVGIDEVILGEILWGTTKGVLYGCAVSLVLIIAGLLEVNLIFLLIPAILISGFLFAAIGMCFTAISPSIDTLNYPAFLFITPMLLFAGTVFPLSVLPHVALGVAMIMPLTHSVEMMRSLSGIAPGGFFLFSVLFVIFFSSISAIYAIKRMHRRLIV